MPVHSNAATRESKHANSEASQITINTEARDVLRDLFPNIPDNDLNQIIKTAFQKGQRKVGTAVELPLARRAQLAVVAHIRHIYTDYDRLLKTTSFHEARSAVEEPTLAKLVEWRGDDENGKTVLEDVFREVIVISDDDDSDAEEGEVSRSINRDHSIEIVSSHQRADELQMRPVNFSHPTVQDSHLDISDDEPPPGFRFIPESPKKRRLDRRGFSRYHAWDRALNRYRKGTYHQHRFYADSTGHPGPLLTARQPVQENITFDPGATCHPHITALRHVSVDPHIASKTEVLHHGQRRTLTRTLKENHVSLQRTDAERSGQKTHIRPPLISHEPSNPGTLLHLPIPRSDASRLADRTEGERVSADQRRALFDQRLNSPNTPVFVGGPTEIQWRGRVPSGAMSRIPGPPYLEMQPNPQDHILPSIETPPLPQQIRRPPSAHLDQLTRRITGGFTIRSVTPRHPAQEDSLPQGESDVRIPASKRRRVANHDPATYIEPRSDVAPIVPVGTHAKQQYVDLGNASPRSLTSQSGAPICRRYMVPVKSPYLAERYPEGSQGPFNYAQPVPEVVVDQRHYSNFKSKSTAWGHQPKHQLEQYRVLYPLQGSPGQKLDVFMKVVESTKKLEKRLICQICRVWGIIIIIIIIIAPSILMGHPGEAYMPMTSYALLIIGMIYDWLANASTVMCKQLDLWILFPDQLMTTFDTIQAGNFLIRRIVHSSIHHIQLQIIEARESVDALMIKPLRIIIALVTTVDMKHTVLLLHLTGMPELMNDKCNI
ncbi:hypothetical protein KXV74_008788 [Aspergillus fumigatus]|nr:hypothetical protein KXX54_004539 [Aspergillus fumigatus]KAH1928082.1 hypothetical protein KXW47_006917 [Aspergillus fumigatus]KAH2027111.1 hypothetical protein KXV65_006738 [Aspergillus fumigatus]KAH2181162.1 hypothetical protein KXV74_008788 [Aspergillus fumigatus]KAH3560757.1 hypothetical protein KXW20_003939 [Aspergillus fumigatus]